MQNLSDCEPSAQTEDHKNALHYLHNSAYGDLDWELTLDYMTRRYIHPLGQEFDLETMHFADCAAGFGWLSFAYLRAGGKHATLIEPDGLRLDAARAIAARLGLSNRCSFICSTLESVPLENKSIDIFACVETLEHVGQTNIAACVETIARCARRGILITTPNALFPVIAHDTRLPFAHWLPKPLRRRYAAWFNRLDQEEGNDFLVPSDLALLRDYFKPVARYQTFSSYREFLRFYPHYLPYGPALNRNRRRPPLPLRLFVLLAGTLFSTHAYRISPNLSNIWIRKAE
jgi:2-polyprenyl-3-methyl-5-hydroxy-6-metoxy-1,4-benzoquinol methylase